LTRLRQKSLMILQIRRSVKSIIILMMKNLIYTHKLRKISLRSQIIRSKSLMNWRLKWNIISAQALEIFKKSITWSKAKETARSRTSLPYWGRTCINRPLWLIKPLNKVNKEEMNMNLMFKSTNLTLIRWETISKNIFKNPC
jgi:hypothetical protein